MLLSTQSVCARLRTLPIIIQIPRGYQKKRLLCRKSAILSIRWKNPILGPSQRLKKLTGAHSCMHKAPKCIQSLWDHPKKISFVQKKNRKRDMCDPSGKHPILRHSQRFKKVLLSTQSVCARLRTLPIIMQIPLRYQKKKFIV